MTPKPKRGGARKGAGRKPAGTKPLVIRLSKDGEKKLRALAKSKGLTLGQAVESVI